MVLPAGGIDVEAWLRGGGHVDAREEERGTTMLMSASARGDEATVAALLQRGASVDLQRNKGVTALMIATNENRLTIVRRLLAAGADPALRDEDGDTAADWAESEGHAAILEILAARRVRLEPPLLCRSALPSSTQLPASSGVAVLEGQGRGRPPEAEGAPPHTLRPPKARRRRRVDADARAVARLHLPLN
jgi:ankyrin repeat protein